VRADEVVGGIGTMALTAPLDGVIRGITRDGVTVSVGTKVVEVDRRREHAIIRGIGERPAQIAAGVARAIQMWKQARPREG
jgi:xanthine dehydrogenase accessory factor